MSEMCERLFLSTRLRKMMRDCRRIQFRWNMFQTHWVAFVQHGVERVKGVGARFFVKFRQEPGTKALRSAPTPMHVSIFQLDLTKQWKNCIFYQFSLLLLLFAQSVREEFNCSLSQPVEAQFAHLLFRPSATLGLKLQFWLLTYHLMCYSAR